MRVTGLSVALVALVTLTACGWSPPSAPPTSTADCGPGPGADAIGAETSMLPAGSWREISRGNTPDCQLYWVVVASGTAPDSPQQALFFDGAAPVGWPTPDPRTYITVTPQGDHNAVVQYQWRQGEDQPCCPTGIGSARVTLEDGRLTVLDPIPGP
ncbi:LppP/LprE family lipoprotein [Mycobacterium sp. Y57]|uniref:LppP/LprE family lipoprotein n=1 Tax=Mycolicibacterium xanthum TaxID=2796469 RepID=UPI001C85176F|nr:LppP/LprE family lipoprotein [Mycolicibacterium xanthum]MBX7431527.1 LppP/LprE family lipoprotein [Mycolicibacterium xanthum]